MCSPLPSVSYAYDFLSGKRVLKFCDKYMTMKRRRFYCQIFHQLTPIVQYRSRLNASHFDVKRSKVKGHSGITYAGNSTLWAEANSTQCSATELEFLVSDFRVVVCHCRMSVGGIV